MLREFINRIKAAPILVTDGDRERADMLAQILSDDRACCFCKHQEKDEFWLSFKRPDRAEEYAKCAARRASYYCSVERQGITKEACGPKAANFVRR